MKHKTGLYNFKKLDYDEVKALRVGDQIAIGVKQLTPGEYEYIEAIVTRPMFWNSDADEPDWEVETTNGFVDIYSIWRQEPLFADRQILAGLQKDVIQLSVDLSHITCKIGKYWFYFGYPFAHYNNVEEYKKQYSMEEIVSQITDALNDYENTGLDESEVLYYKAYLEENVPKEALVC